VFAYAEELDAWMRNRGRMLVVEPLEIRHNVQRGSPPDAAMYFGPNGAVDDSLISAEDRARSDAAVALAYKMWETLSNRNLMAITRLFREGIELNPRSAMAFVGLSHALIVSATWGLMSAPSAYASAEAALRRALEIDAELAEVKCAEAWLKLHWRRDWDGAAHDLDELLRQNISTSRVMLGRAMAHIASGNLNMASALLKEAAELHQLSTTSAALQCWVTYLSGECAHALEQIDEMRAGGLTGPVIDAVEALVSIQLKQPDAQIEHIQALVAHNPRQNVLHGALGYAYAAANQRQKAAEILHALKRQAAKSNLHASYASALVLIGLKQNQEAIQYIERSYRSGSLWSIGFLSDPILAPLRSHPEFQQFLSGAAYTASPKIPLRPIPIRRSEPWTVNTRASAQA